MLLRISGLHSPQHIHLIHFYFAPLPQSFNVGFGRNRTFSSSFYDSSLVFTRRIWMPHASVAWEALPSCTGISVFPSESNPPPVVRTHNNTRTREAASFPSNVSIGGGVGPDPQELPPKAVWFQRSGEERVECRSENTKNKDEKQGGLPFDTFL